MSEQLVFSSGTMSDSQKYEELLPQIYSLVTPEEPLVTSFSNIAASLKQAFEKISWVGFYLMKNGMLYLGPFQGKIACTMIKPGSGVCGTVAKTGKTMIVPDVDKFPGHIACDADSRSEIVLPLFHGSTLYGVLDIDSHFYNSFNETDQMYLEKLCVYINDTLIKKHEGRLL